MSASDRWSATTMVLCRQGRVSAILTGMPASTVNDNDILDIGFHDMPDLHERLAALRAAGPIAEVRYLGEPAWEFLTFEALRAALRDEESFPLEAIHREVTDPAVGRSIMSMSGEEHVRNRGLLSPSFRKRTVTRYVEPIVLPTCHELIDAFEGRREVDLVAEFTHLLPMLVTTKLLGLPSREYEIMERWSNDLFMFNRDPACALRARREFTEYLEHAVEERRAEPRDDLMSRLVVAQQEGGGLDDEEVYSFLRLLFPAGVHNTANALGNTIWALLTQCSDGFERVRTEPDASYWAVEETLRWEGPLPNMARRSVRAGEWCGTEIPAGALVIFGQASAHRDPAAFIDPDRFDLDRLPEEILAFGLGAHFCIGAALARQEIRVALEVLAERTGGLRLVDPEASRPVGGVMRAPKALPVVIDW